MNAEALEVRRANVVYHTKMAGTYDRDSAHYAAENRERVGAILRGLAAQTGGGVLLDLGCGTGFITRLARPAFASVVAVDMTPAMLRQLPRTSTEAPVLGHVTRLPFRDETFDAVACYGTLHHLYSPEAAAAESFRCLRRGGVFYSDSDPHAPFFRAVRELPQGGPHSPIVQREIASTAGEAEKTASEFQMDCRTVEMAEYQKMVRGRFRRTELEAIFVRAGFREVRVEPEWFLGQAAVMHGQSFELAGKIEAHLRDCLPLSEGLFKYLKVIARK